MFRWTSSCSRSIWTEQLSSYHAELCLPPSLLPSPFFAAEQVSQVQPCVSGLFVKCWRSYSHRITVEKDKKREWEFLWTCILSIKQQVTLRTAVSTKNLFLNKDQVVSRSTWWHESDRIPQFTARAMPGQIYSQVHPFKAFINTQMAGKVLWRCDYLHSLCLLAYGWTIGKMQVYWWRLQVSSFRTTLVLFAHFDMLLWWR